MSTLVDSNILIDIFETASRHFEWSSRQLEEARLAGPIIINVVVAAEVAHEFRGVARMETALGARFFVREDIPWPGAYRAGLAYRDYRSRGGSRERTLPDFLIGAHAELRQHRLLTRDARRYRTYFPALDIIAPDTHP